MTYEVKSTVDAAAGARMFARYAYAPNRLGYCGPPEPGTLAQAAVPSADTANGAGRDVRAMARRFSGVWPYLQVMARMTGIADPLDLRVVESYWLGGGVGAGIDQRAFGEHLLAVLGPQAGGYWKHLNPQLFDEAAANHSFHVFGVYPWSRLLGSGTDPAADHALSVLDGCRIRWGTVLSRDEDEIEVSTRHLTWDGAELGLGEPSIELVRVSVDGLGFLPDVDFGDRVALHWDWLTDRLRPDQSRALEESTKRQLAATNVRLARASGPRRAPR